MSTKNYKFLLNINSGGASNVIPWCDILKVFVPYNISLHHTLVIVT